MKEIKFRDLRPEELEIRIGNTLKDSETGKPYAFQLMLYKTARVDANILDETFGIFGWKNNFYQVKNTMVCSISIWDSENKQWVNKDNGGDDDFNTEQVKAELSDSIKRAGFNLGIGRKLYTANKIYMVVNIDKDNTTKSYYKVDDIGYDETSITKLVISNKKTHQVVISYGSNIKVSQTSQKGQENTITPPKATLTPDEINKQHEENITLIGRYLGKLDNDRYVKFFDWIEKSYGVRDYKQLSVEQAQKTINAWKMK